jgi:hypothetical protein
VRGRADALRDVLAPVAFVAGLVALVVLAAMVWTRLPAKAEGPALYASVRDAAKTYEEPGGGYGCRRVRGTARTWDCVVPDSDSGVMSYRVTVRRGSSCWDGRRRFARDSRANRLSGCVTHRLPV